MNYDFQPELALASTLPAAQYFGDASHRRDVAVVFARSWALVGRTDQISRVGDYFTARLADENLLFVRGADGVVRGFYNVCRHRAGPLATGAGNSTSLRCQYHGWTYALDGKLRAAPEFQGVQNFELQKCKLPEVHVRTWGPLVFAAIEPAMSFDDFVGTAPVDLKNCHLEKMKFYCAKDYPLNANWKVYVDNYLERLSLARSSSRSV